MQLTAYLGTVIALVTLSLGAFYFITSNLGNQLGARMTSLEPRMDRLEDKMDRLFEAVAEMGARISALERRFET